MTQNTSETTETTESTSVQDQLRELLTRYRAYQQTFVAETTPAEQAASGEANHWSLKDHFGHINYWQRQALNNLQAAAKGETPANANDDFQPVNERVFAERQQAVWADLMAESQQLSDEFAALIGQFTDEEWTDPNRYPWRNGALALGPISSFYDHPIDHFAQLYREQGDAARELALREESLQFMGEVFGQTELYGNSVYNLGCFYALHDAPEKALMAIEQSLKLNPALVEWSKQDSDLDSLREMPAFQALYTA